MSSGTSKIFSSNPSAEVGLETQVIEILLVSDGDALP
jgi:hypothetical protein